MIPFIKNRLPLAVILILFVCCKIPHLHLAYYWDECWPYASAIKAMYRHGISLHPSAIDPNLSHGHPLFFHAAAAAWMKVFGVSHISMHSFALFISVLFLIAIYEAGLRLFGVRMAVLALLSVVMQEIFFVQSSMVLPEVLVAFLCFMSFVCYARQKYLFTALCLVLLFYTKESGLVAGFIIGCDALISFFNSTIALRQRIYRILAVATPCLLIFIFFVLQHQLRGWYLFPDHIKLTRHTWDGFWYGFRINCVSAEFTDYYYFLFLVVLAAIFVIKQKQPRYLVILLPLVCIYYFVDDMRAGRLLPGVPFFIVFLASVGWFLYEYTKLFAEPAQKRLVLLFSLFILCYLVFSGMNFFTPRYLIASIVPMLFISSAIFDAFIHRIGQWLIYPVLCAIVLAGAYSYTSNDHYGDCDHLFVNAVAVHQDVVNYFEEHNLYDKQLATGDFLEYKHFSDPATGFLHTDKVFPITWEINEKTDYVIFDNIEYDSRYEQFKKDTAFELVKRMERGTRWGEVYKRKPR